MKARSVRHSRWRGSQRCPSGQLSPQVRAVVVPVAFRVASSSTGATTRDRIIESVSTGIFSARGSTVADAHSLAVTAADFDGDGAADFAVTGRGSENIVYGNEGGSLVPAWSSGDPEMTCGVATVDDDDGDPDLLFGESSTTVGSHLYRNDGGELTEVWTTPMTGDVTYGIAAALEGPW